MFKNVAGKLVAVAPVSAFIASAHAALPAGVEDAIETVQADGLLLVGALAIAGASVFIIHKLMKRFGISL